MDTDLIITVERKTETQLIRHWITIIDPDKIELYTRRSVVLCMGTNEVTLTWTKGKAGTPDRAVLFETQTSLEVLASSKVISGNYYFKLYPGDTVTMHWTLMGTP